MPPCHEGEHPGVPSTLGYQEVTLSASVCSMMSGGRGLVRLSDASQAGCLRTPVAILDYNFPELAN